MRAAAERDAFPLLDRALQAGYPVRPRDVLDPSRFQRKDIPRITRAYARSGRASYTSFANADWLVPDGARLDVEQFHFMQSPRAMDALRFARDTRIFTQKDMFRRIAGDGDVDADARRRAARLWHLDLVEYRSTDDGGEKYFAITPRGLKLLAEAERYRAPAFATRSESRDLARFHAVLDLEPVRDP